ncbi:MAG: hypothetical protein PHR30_12460 [Gallionellaceae bacterium]|nr:hypothetical protein [Gallionellaceae bacterium]
MLKTGGVMKKQKPIFDNLFFIFIKIIRSKIAWCVFLFVYLFAVWLSAYMIETASMGEWKISKNMGCPHGKEFRIFELEKKPNPWIFESTNEIVFSYDVLNNPTCFVAYLKDISSYKYPCNITILDKDRNNITFSVVKYRTY